MLGLSLAALPMTWYYLSKSELGGFDPYFHLRCTLEYVRTGGPLHTTWFAAGVLQHEIADREPLFHLLPVPLVWLFSPELGYRLYGAVLCIGITWGAWLHVRRFPLAVVLFSLGSSLFLARLCFPRPHMLAIIILLLLLYCLKFQKYALGLLALAASCVAYSVPAIAVAAWFGYWALAVVKSRGRKIGAAAVWIAGGAVAVAASYCLSPYYPDNVKILKVQSWDTLFQAWSNVDTLEPQELAPATARDFVFGAGVSVVLIIACLRSRARSVYGELVLGLCLCALVASILSVRFIEYLHPLAFALLGHASVEATKAMRDAFTRFRTAATVALCFLVIANLGMLISFAMEKRPPMGSAFRDVGSWLHDHVRGEVVFNDYWPGYAELVYFSPGNRYVAGMGLVFLSMEDNGRDLKWYLEVKRARSVEAVVGALRHFDAEVMVVTNESRLALLCETSRRYFEELYRGRNASVFALREGILSGESQMMRGATNVPGQSGL